MHRRGIIERVLLLMGMLLSSFVVLSGKFCIVAVALVSLQFSPHLLLELPTVVAVCLPLSELLRIE